MCVLNNTYTSHWPISTSNTERLDLDKRETTVESRWYEHFLTYGKTFILAIDLLNTMVCAMQKIESKTIGVKSGSSSYQWSH